MSRWRLTCGSDRSVHRRPRSVITGRPGTPVDQTAPLRFQPPRPRLIPSQQYFYNIYPMGAAGVQVLMCDGSVRGISTSISVEAWSAGITPNGGEAISVNAN